MPLALDRAKATRDFPVKPTDPSTFAAVSLLLAMVAMAAEFVPAWRATRVDSVIALRLE